ncbi:hypothetical protein V2J09_005878 [Rumex salicifolius]
MVAISLYRGNLHRVEDVPRRWVMPRPGISIKDFRGLLRRRSKALSLLNSRPALASTSNPSTTSNGNPPPCLPPLPPPPPVQKRPDEQSGKEHVKSQAREFPSIPALEADNIIGNVDMGDGKAEDVAMEALVHLASLGEGKAKEELENCNGGCTEVLQVEKDKGEGEEKEKKIEDPNFEGSHRSGASDEKEKRKKEVEEKLEILTKKKHSLVQALKQILSAEEELKRKSSLTTRPSVSLQVDVSNDSGSMTRVATPRTGSEANLGCNAGGGEADDVLNHDLQSRHIPRMSSISPSAESSLKRPYYFQHNAASNPPRSSPLRFAFPGNQAQPLNSPAVTVPATNYTVSSSPAASVGTSSFKDTRSASS